MTDKAKSIQLAAIIALLGNAILAALKITAGTLGGSGALIGDGIDSSNVYDVMIHVEPLGEDDDETYGLSEYEMRGPG